MEVNKSAYGRIANQFTNTSVENNKLKQFGSLPNFFFYRAPPLPALYAGKG
jgi:hypothetical protein